MRFSRTVVSLMALAALSFAATAEAQTRAHPFQFGLNTLAFWGVGAGRPAGGDSLQYGLYLAKAVQADYAAAGATLTPLPSGLTSTNLSELSFQIPGTTDITTFNGPEHANGYCGAGSPRFNAHSSSPSTCFLGCAHGSATQDPVTGWWTVSFTGPFTSHPGCEGGITGTLQSISMIFDESGTVVVDNITIKRPGQTTVMGAP